jgi:hypothetical protein
MRFAKLGVMAILSVILCGPLFGQPASAYAAPARNHYRQKHSPHPHTIHHMKKHHNTHKIYKH